MTQRLAWELLYMFSMKEAYLLEVLLWQPLTGGRIHFSVKAPDGVHHCTVCGSVLDHLVAIAKPKPWHEVVSCKSCRELFRMMFRRDPMDWQPRDRSYGELYEWREAQEKKQRNGLC